MADAKTDQKTSPREKQAEAQTKSQPQAVRQAAGTWAETIQEAAGTIAESAIALQDRNMQFAQTLVDRGFTQIETQTATLHELANKLYRQSPERRAALRGLAREASAAYLRLLTAPVRAYRRRTDGDTKQTTTRA